MILFDLNSLSFLCTPCVMTLEKEVSNNFFLLEFLVVFDLKFCVSFNIVLAWWQKLISFYLKSWSFLIWTLESFLFYSLCLLIYSLRHDSRKRSFHKFHYSNSKSFFIWNLVSFVIYSFLDDKRKKFQKFLSIYFYLNSCVFFNILLARWHQKRHFHNFLSI